MNARLFENGPSGAQIAFLVIAVMLLAAPLDKYLIAPWLAAQGSELQLGRMVAVLLAAGILLVVPSLRRQCRHLLSRPARADRLVEVPMALALNFFAILGCMGAFALWHWIVGGEPALARRMGEQSTDAQHWAAAVSPEGIVFVVFSATLGPFVEELVFRGVLFHAWTRQWGWARAAVGTSIVFGFLHGAFFPQVIASFIFIAVMRRSGSIWSAIAVHCASNLLLWYPLLGQFLLPAGRSTGELQVWTVNLAAFVVAWFAIPIYVWLARDSEIPR